MTELVYCATPSRLVNKTEEIMDFVQAQGYAPFHPFVAFPYERFEGGSVGRERTIEICKRTIQICEKFWLFGVSEGTLDELVEAMKKGKPIRQFLEQFDPEWKEYYSRLGARYGNPLEEIPKRKA